MLLKSSQVFLFVRSGPVAFSSLVALVDSTRVGGVTVSLCISDIRSLH